jgi:hypothetical protein
MMFLAFVTHDVRSNTLEATWLEEIKDADGNIIEYKRVKCRNYPSEQKAEFLADCGEGADKYTTMAGW